MSDHNDDADADDQSESKLKAGLTEKLSRDADGMNALVKSHLRDWADGKNQEL